MSTLADLYFLHLHPNAAFGILLWELLSCQSAFTDTPALQVGGGQRAGFLCVQGESKMRTKVQVCRVRRGIDGGTRVDRQSAPISHASSPTPTLCLRRRCPMRSLVQILWMVAHQKWRPPVPEGCPPELADLMQRCWHGDEKSRSGQGSRCGGGPPARACNQGSP